MMILKTLLFSFAAMAIIFAASAQSQDSTASYLNSSMLKGYALKAAPGNTRDNGLVYIVKLQGAAGKEQLLDSLYLENLAYCAGDTNGIAILQRSAAIRCVIFAWFGDKIKYDTVYEALEGTPQDHIGGHALLCASLKDSVLVLAGNDSGRVTGTQVVRIAPHNVWQVEIESPQYAAPSMTFDFKQLLMMHYPAQGTPGAFGTLYTYDLATHQKTDIIAAGDSILVARQLYEGLPIVYAQFSGENVNLFWTDGSSTKPLTELVKPQMVRNIEILPTEKVLRYAIINLTKPGRPEFKDIPFSQIGW